MRLHPNDELRSSLQEFAKHQGIQAGFVITCVGALRDLTIRLAGATPSKQAVETYDQEFEIVSLAGTVTADDCHLHIAVSDTSGKVLGGHLKSAKIGVTAEVIIGEDESVVYERVMDKITGFEELEIRQK